MEDPTIGFIREYYRQMDQSMRQVEAFYRDVSTISFEGTTVVGGQKFLELLGALGIPPGTFHVITTIEAQPSQIGSGAVIVFVTGEYAKNKFQEVFQLVPTQAPSFPYYIHNAIFRVGNNNPLNCPPDVKDLCTQFMSFYYKEYQGNRANLRGVYRSTSLYSYEDDKKIGVDDIMKKIAEAPPLMHDNSSLTMDAHKIHDSIVLIFISGQLTVDGSHPLKFTEMFLLMKDAVGFFIGNEIFRLNYG